MAGLELQFGYPASSGFQLMGSWDLPEPILYCIREMGKKLIRLSFFILPVILAR